MFPSTSSRSRPEVVCLEGAKQLGVLSRFVTHWQQRQGTRRGCGGGSGNIPALTCVARSDSGSSQSSSSELEISSLSSPSSTKLSSKNFVNDAASCRMFVHNVAVYLDSVANFNLCKMGEEETCSMGNLFASSKNQTICPKISLRTYLTRAVAMFDTWAENYFEADIDFNLNLPSVGIRTLVTGMCLYERLVALNQGNFKLQLNNRHRVIVTCMLVALKLNEDYPFSNELGAQVAGVELAEMNRLECNLCKCLGYKLFVHSHEFEMICNKFASIV